MARRKRRLIAELDRRIAQYTDYMEAAEFRKALGELRAIWVAGNEYLTTRRALDPHQDRPRQGGGGRAHGAEPGASVRASGLAGDARDGARSSMNRSSRSRRRRLIPWPDQPMAKALDELEPGQRSIRRKCCSPRSPTSRWRNGKRGFRRRGLNLTLRGGHPGNFAGRSRRCADQTAEPLPAVMAQRFQRREARLVIHLLGVAHPIAEIDIRQPARLARLRHDPGSCRCPGCAPPRRDGRS